MNLDLGGPCIGLVGVVMPGWVYAGWGWPAMSGCVALVLCLATLLARAVELRRPFPPTAPQSRTRKSGRRVSPEITRPA